MIQFTFQTLWITNIILLTVGPIILLMMIYLEHIARVTSRIRSGYSRAAIDDVPRQSFAASMVVAIEDAAKVFWHWSNFWIVLLLGVGFQLLLVVGYARLNPFVSI